MTKTKAKTGAKPAPKPAAKKKRAFTRFDIERFKRLAAEISAFRHDVPHWYIARAKSVEGLLLTETPKGSGRYVAAVAGLKTRPVSTEQQALKIWANKARRAVLKAEG